MIRLSAVDLTEYTLHGYPFRLVDSLEIISEVEVIGRKYIGWNEPFFQGHFPGNPELRIIILANYHYRVQVSNHRAHEN